MNWILILLVSLLGVLIGVVNIFGLIDISPWFISIALWIISALILGRFAHKKYFGHGFFAGLIASAVSSVLVYFFYDTYIANNPEIAEHMRQLPEGMDARSMMLFSSVVGAAIGGVVLGLLTMLTGKLFGEPEKAKPAETPPAPPQEDSDAAA